MGKYELFGRFRILPHFTFTFAIEFTTQMLCTDQFKQLSFKHLLYSYTFRMAKHYKHIFIDISFDELRSHKKYRKMKSFVM